MDADPRLGRRRRRPEQEDGDREQEDPPQAGTFSGTRTRRLKVIAPSSSEP
jgi:hypothetical protein